MKAFGSRIKYEDCEEQSYEFWLYTLEENKVRTAKDHGKRSHVSYRLFQWNFPLISELTLNPPQFHSSTNLRVRKHLWLKIKIRAPIL